MKINDDLKNEDMPLEQKERLQRMHELVEQQMDIMDMEDLISYATDKLFEYFDGKSDDEIKALYKEDILDYED